MNDKFKHLKLKILKQEYQYTLLKNETDKNSILALVKSIKAPVGIFLSESEFSLIAPRNIVFENLTEKTEAGWSCLQVVGEMPFGTVKGLIASISNSLFSAGIGICVVSTFKSDWFFVSSKNLEQAAKILAKDGWNVEKE